jgi:hypothetical protein
LGDANPVGAIWSFALYNDGAPGDNSVVREQQGFQLTVTRGGGRIAYEFRKYLYFQSEKKMDQSHNKRPMTSA